MKGSDTTAAAQAMQIAALRRLGREGRLRLAAEMSEDARRIAVLGERRRHPGAGEMEARRAVFRRLYGDLLADRVERARPVR